MNKIVDFPRKNTTTNDKFSPALHGVIGKMTYLENANGYWSEDIELMTDRLEELGIFEKFIEGFKNHKKNKTTFEIPSPATGEIFAIFEDLELPAGESYFMGFFAFKDEFSYSCKRFDLYTAREPDIREQLAREAIEDADFLESLGSVAA